jgi:UDP-GlcNAc:undecaprenyl-phosphate/decaprenyl-phosphate GlcNAc-1-phosphate transferase
MHLKNLLSFEIQVVLAGVLAFLTCYFMIPKILLLVRDKKLMENKEKQTSNETLLVPRLGGIGIYFGFLIPLLLFSGINESKILPFLTASCVVIFLFSLKNDINFKKFRIKYIGQVIASVIIIVIGNIRITHLHGILGIGEISYLISFLISLFICMLVTNAINLIDGIDGLAASIGIIAAFGFGSYFFYLHRINSSIGCSSLIGTLSAFLIFNYSKGEKKIFMGDTGSQIIGFILATFAIFFNEVTLVSPVELKVKSAPVVMFAILAIPIFDLLRVLITRIFKGKSPFKGEKKHIHHELIVNGYSHHKATMLIAAYSIFLIIITYTLSSKVGFYPLLLILTTLVILFYIIPFTYLYRKLKSKKQTPNK